MVGVALVGGLLFGRQMLLSRNLPRAQFEPKIVRLLTYASFIGTSGPGTQILETFERQNQVKFEVVTSADAGLLLQRLKMNPPTKPFDVVLGLDQLLLGQARTDFEWRPLNESREGWASEPAAQSDAQFSAFDWSPLTFIYKKTDAPIPTTFDQILDPAFKQQWVVQDPHVSTPGLEFFKWVKTLKGDGTKTWLETFKDRVQTIAPTWAFSYGLLEKGQVRFVFSYVTSLAYHWDKGVDRSYQALSFPEGHPVQVELVAIPKDCAQCELAEKFVQYLHTEDMQKLIMQKNFMFPVLKGLTQGTVFAELPTLKTIPVDAGKDLSEWDQVFKK